MNEPAHSHDPADPIILSTVTPVYQGCEDLVQLVERLSSVRSQLAELRAPLQLGEAIFADDGSIDNSSEVLARLAEQFEWIRVLTLSRNFGQHAATIAGILHSCGDWVATLDEDLQHPPERLVPMLRYLVDERLDIVFANSEAAVHGSVFRDASSRVYKTILSRLSGNPHVRYFNSFRMIRGSIARAAAAVASHETYFDVALCWFSTRIGNLTMPLRDDRCRSGRRSGYGLGALLRHARRLLVSSELKPLRLGALVGLATLLVSLILIVVVAVSRIFFFLSWIEVRGWASTLVAIMFFGGLSSFLIGIVLEYMGILLMRAHGKPTFLTVDRSQDERLRTWFQEECRQ